MKNLPPQAYFFYYGILQWYGVKESKGERGKEPNIYKA